VSASGCPALYALLVGIDLRCRPQAQLGATASPVPLTTGPILASTGSSSQPDEQRDPTLTAYTNLYFKAEVRLLLQNRDNFSHWFVCSVAGRPPDMYCHCSKTRTAEPSRPEKQCPLLHYQQDLSAETRCLCPVFCADPRCCHHHLAQQLQPL